MSSCEYMQNERETDYQLGSRSRFFVVALGTGSRAAQTNEDTQ